MTNQTIAEGSSANLSPNTFVKAGWNFAGWATTAAGSAVYSDQASFDMGNSDVTLYAKWTPKNLTITFNKNDLDASGSMIAQTIPSGSSALLSANTFTKNGWSFAGWATTSGGNVAYNNQANYKMGTENVTLYAKWTPNNYTVYFDKNNNDVYTSMDPQVIANGSTANLKANTFSDDCRTFVGWSTSKTGAAQYADKSSYTMGAQDVTLYAIWKAKSLDINPKYGVRLEVCIHDPITLPPCAQSYEWHFVSFGGDQIILPTMSEFSGAGTNTLKIITEAGMDIYCKVTDLDGNVTTTGTWFVGGAFCEYDE